MDRPFLIFVRSLFQNHSIWDIESGECVRVLKTPGEPIRCINSDSKRILSGSYEGAIKLWDLNAALNPRCPSNSLCVKTFDQVIDWSLATLFICISTTFYKILRHNC